MPRLPRALRNLGLVGAADAVGKLLGLGTVAITARELGPSGLGALAVLLALLAYQQIFSSLGLSQWGLRRAIVEGELQRGLAGRIIGLQTVSTLLLIPLVALAIRILDGRLDLAQLGLICALACLGHIRADWVAQATGRYKLLAGSRVLHQALLLLLTAAFLPNSSTVTTVLSLQVVSLTIASLVVWFGLRSALNEGDGTQTIRWSSDRVAFLLALTVVFQTVYFNIDRIMLGASVSNEALGQYEGAYRILTLHLSLPIVVSAVTAPIVLAAAAGRTDRLETVARFAALAAICAGVLSAVSAHFLQEVMLGDAFDASPPLVALLSVSVGVAWLQLLFGPALQAARREGRQLFVMIAAAAVNIGLNLLLIPRLGIEGAAWSTVVAEIVVALGLLLAMRSLLSKELLAALVIGLVVPALVGILVFRQRGAWSAGVAALGIAALLTLIRSRDPGSAIADTGAA